MLKRALCINVQFSYSSFYKIARILRAFRLVDNVFKTIDYCAGKPIEN